MINKRNLLLLASSFLFAACISYSPVNDEEVGKITVSCSLEQYSSDGTKSVFVEDSRQILWEAGDAISLFQGNGSMGGFKFESMIAEPSAVSNFTGVIPAVTGGGEVASEQVKFYGIFPYSTENKSEGDILTTRIKSVQYAREYSFEHDVNPTIAVSNNLELGFYNICGGIRFTVANPGINSIVIRGNNNEPIAGLVNVQFIEGEPKIVGFESADEEIRVIAPSGGFVPGTPYYVLMAPTDFTNGFSVTFNKGTQQGTRTISSEVVIARRIYSKLTGSDKDFEYAENTGNVYFVDPAFKSYCVSLYDEDGNGEIDASEAASVTYMDFRPEDYGIVDLTGIEYFKNLDYLSCCGSEGRSGHQDGTGTIQHMDISNNTKLKYLDMSSNAYNIKTLDLRYFSELDHLSVGNSRVNEVLFAGNPLTYLCASETTITSVDLSSLTQLKRLEIGSANITSLDVSHCVALKELLCFEDDISELDLSNNLLLEGLDCGRCNLSSLDLSSNSALQVLKCDCNNLSALDVSNLSELYHLQFGCNKVEFVDISHLTKLTAIAADGNKLSSLDLSNAPLLSYLDCNNNSIASLDVTGCPDLTYLDCSSNRITTMDISPCSKLEEANFSSMNVGGSNVLETVYVDKYQKINGITVARSADRIPASTQILVKGTVSFTDSAFESYCLAEFDSNGDGVISYSEVDEITELDIDTDLYKIEDLSDIKYFSNLETLSCVGNGESVLKTIDLTWNTKLNNADLHNNVLENILLASGSPLTYLDVSDNALSTLTLSACSKLGHLDCSGNNISAISLTSNPALSWLDCSDNELTSLNLSNNSSLSTLYCSGNDITALDVSHIYSLSQLDISGNDISAINTDRNTYLTEFICSGNPMSSGLSLGKNKRMVKLECSGCGLESLDLTANVSLRKLNVSANSLTGLDVSSLTCLASLDCSANLIQELNVSSNPLHFLDCSPMNDSEGNNVLSIVYLGASQTIPGINVTRDPELIPEQTAIVTDSPAESGGTEGVGVGGEI